MDDYDSYNDNEPDWMAMCAEMTNTIDALNTNVILLNKFIESALDKYDLAMNFKENIEITTFDASGNIMTCVKSDGSGNFFPCVFMDLSSNMIPCVLPDHDSDHDNNINTKRERSFSPYSPYYYPYYSPYYTPYYSPYNSLYSPYYNPYYSLLNNTSSYRDIPVKNMMNTPPSNGPTNRNSPHYQSNHQSYNRPPNRPSHHQSYHRPSYHQSYHRPSYHRPSYYPIYNCPQCQPIHHRPEHDDCMNN